MTMAVSAALGYLKLGQLSRDLSGGEAQRLKLALFFNKTIGEGDVVFLDEPTSGLHMADVERLMEQLAVLRQRGATIVIIEHQLHVLRRADWVIELDAVRAKGGTLVFEGTPGELSHRLDRFPRYINGQRRWVRGINVASRVLRARIINVALRRLHAPAIFSRADEPEKSSQTSGVLVS